VSQSEYEIASAELGHITISGHAIAEIVGYAAAESYGVVALAGRHRLSRYFPWGIRKGVDVEMREDGLAIEVRVVVEHGLKLAEIATTVRERIVYELERMVGLPVAALEVHIERVRDR
jgi:uncharacterized alkaline shock family protein YloU